MKKGLIAQERQRTDLKLARRGWLIRRQPRMAQEPHRLVFIDETSVKTNMTRLRGRSPVGERLFGTAPFGRWQTQTLIAGLSCDDLIAGVVVAFLCRESIMARPHPLSAPPAPRSTRAALPAR